MGVKLVPKDGLCLTEGYNALNTGRGCKKVPLLLHYEILSKVEKFHININIDKVPTKYVPVGQSSLAKKIWAN